jgi:hypothetical protein
LVRLFSSLLLIAVLGGSFDQTAWTDEGSVPMSLWKTVVAPSVSEHPPAQSKPWVLRDREIVLDLQVLQILKDAAARPHPPISIELFNGVRHELDITSTVSRINDTAVIRGSFKPPAQGDFTFVASGDLLIGTIRLGNRLYKTEHVGNGRLQLLEIDPDKMPPD